MFGSLAAEVNHPNTRVLTTTGLGVGALMLGRRKTGITLFCTGFLGMEKHWREENAFEGTLAERWADSIRFCESTNEHNTNRILHMAGIPTILLGTVGLLTTRVYSPLWFASNAAFIVDWGLNFVGHGIYEKNAPALQDDPLSFIAGPVWDVQQFRNLRKEHAQAAHAAE